jgi:glycosyltransferase
MGGPPFSVILALPVLLDKRDWGDFRDFKMISIITATWNASATLRDCLDSVKAQKGTGTFGASPLEHIIVDGGSTDGTLEIVRDHASRGQAPDGASPRTRFISEPDNGIYDAMNKGIRMATGEIVGLLNADDFYADGRVLERVAKVFEDPEVEACFGDLVYVREMLNCASRVKLAPVAPLNRLKDPSIQRFNHSTVQPGFTILRYWKSGSFSPGKFKWGWMPPHPTFFVRRSVYERFGLFNLDLGSAADYELMLRFLLRHRVRTAYIPEVLVNMRAGGVSNASLGNRLRANRMDRKAWEVNGLRPYPWTLFFKPMRKVPQYFLKPNEIQYKQVQHEAKLL